MTTTNNNQPTTTNQWNDLDCQETLLPPRTDNVYDRYRGIQNTHDLTDILTQHTKQNRTEQNGIGLSFYMEIVRQKRQMNQNKTNHKRNQNESNTKNPHLNNRR